MFGTFTPGSLAGRPGRWPVRRQRPGQAGDRGTSGTSEPRWAGTSSRTSCGSSLASSSRPSATSTSRSFNRRHATGQTQRHRQLHPTAASATSRASTTSAKLTYLISSDHRVSLSVTGTPTTAAAGAGRVLRNRSSQRGIPGARPVHPRHLQLHIPPRPKFDALDVAGRAEQLLHGQEAAPRRQRRLVHVSGTRPPRRRELGLTRQRRAHLAARGVPLVAHRGTPTPVYEPILRYRTRCRPACSCSGGAILRASAPLLLRRAGLLETLRSTATRPRRCSPTS